MANSLLLRPLSAALVASLATLVAACSASPDNVESPDAPTAGEAADGDTTLGADGTYEESNGTASYRPEVSDEGLVLEDVDDGEQLATAAAAGAIDLSKVTARKWTWFPIPGASCRDGSQAGFSLNVNSPSKKLVIYLQGGGGCFDPVTCSQNPSKVGAKSMSVGLLDRSKSQNPVDDWNYAYVPYCTGDVHAGNQPSGKVTGLPTQKFVGYANMALFLQSLKATFPGTTQVLLAGESAGGFGAAANYLQTARTFSNVKVNLIDDSGPLLRSPALATCLQSHFRTTWGLDKTVIKDCGATCQNQADYMIAASKFAARTYPGYAQGLVSSTEDSVIRQFFGFGANSCRSYAAVTGSAYRAGVLDFRSQHAPYENYGVYAYGGTSHTILNKSAFFSRTVSGKSLVGWVDGIVNGNDVTNVGP